MYVARLARVRYAMTAAVLCATITDFISRADCRCQGTASRLIGTHDSTGGRTPPANRCASGSIHRGVNIMINDNLYAAFVFNI